MAGSILYDSDEHYSFSWLLYSRRFFIAAQKMEEIVRKAEKIWNDEAKKLQLKPGKWTPGIKMGKRWVKAEIIRDCHHAIPYLYCHSLELMFKSIACAFKDGYPPKNNHSLKNLFDRLKNILNHFLF